jgi:hypothetical protein
MDKDAGDPTRREDEISDLPPPYSPDPPPNPFPPPNNPPPPYQTVQILPRVVVGEAGGVDVIQLEDGTVKKRTRKKGQPEDPIEPITIKRRFKLAKKKRGNVYMEKFWSLLSGDRPQNFRLYLWLGTLGASFGVSMFQTFQYIAKYESAPTSTLVTTSDDKEIPLPAIFIEEPYYPYKTNESGTNTLFLKRGKLFVRRDNITGDGTTPIHKATKQNFYDTRLGIFHVMALR